MHAGLALAWLAAGAGIAAALVVPGVWLPSDRLGVRRFQVPVDPSMTVAQEFAMTADGFHAIEFSAAAVGDPVSGTLRLELEEEGSGIVRSAEVSAAQVIAAPSYRFAFEPIEDSKDAVYRLDIASSERDPSKGLAVWATKGDRSAGTMLINGRERWGDLAFTTFAPAGRSAWRRLMDLADEPSGLSRGHLVLAGLAAYWLALGIVLAAMCRPVR